MDRIEADAAWVERVLLARERGDHGPFGEIVETYSGRVLSVLRGCLSNEADAEDVAQDVFTKVYRSLHRFNRKSCLFTWIYRVAINAAHDHRKKNRRHRAASLSGHDGSGERGEDAMQIADPAATHGSRRHAEGNERAHAVHGALAEMPERFRTILVLRELEGMSYEEISSALKIKKGTVESRLFRARQMLRQVAERLHLEELL